MPRKSAPSPKRISRIRIRKGSASNVARAEVEAVISLLNERGEIINAIRRELHSAYRDLSSQVEKNRQALETQLTRIAQLQQEIDALKRRA